MNQNHNAAVFLDRDGTIIEDRGHLYDSSQVVFFPETFRALKKLRKSFQLFIVTNQSGIAKGLVGTEDVEKVNRHILSILSKEGIEISEVYVCPHQRSDNCECIKPKPYFLQQAASRYHIDLQRSFVIGDHPCDVQLAENVGARGLFVLSGHGHKHVKEISAEAEVVPGIKEAAEKILAENHCHSRPRSDIKRP